MFERIIVPLDGSLRAEHALPVAARLAHASGGSLHLLQIISTVVDYGGMGIVPFASEQSVEMEIAQSMDYLNTLAALPLLTGIHITCEVTFGLPAQQILASAASQKTNLIILCSHGRTGFTRWALGSVAHQLVHQSFVPMLILREHEAPSLFSYRNDAQSFCTLVPLDGSELAEAALMPAAYLTAALAAPTHGALHLVQVVKNIPAAAEGDSASELNEEALRLAKAYLATTAEHMQATVKKLNLSLTYSVEHERDVASTLVNVTEQKHKSEEAENAGGSDLIAISTHGRGGFERLMMGSVTDRLLNTTTRPMLIVRPHKIGDFLNEEKHDVKQKKSDLQREPVGSSEVR